MDLRSEHKHISEEIDRLKQQKLELENEIEKDTIAYFQKKVDGVTWEYEYSATLMNRDFSKADYDVYLTSFEYGKIQLTPTISFSLYDDGGLLAEIYFDSDDDKNLSDEFLTFLKTHKVTGRKTASLQREEISKSIEGLNVIIDLLDD